MRRHLALLACVAGAALLGACSGDDDDAAPTTATTPDSTAPDTTAPVTTTPVSDGAPVTTMAAGPALFPSVDNFASQWEQANGAMGELNPDVRPLPLDARDLPLVDSDVGDLFAIAPSDDTFIAGQVDPATGAVTSLLVGVDPVSDLGPSVVRTMLGVTADVSNIADVVQAYSILANQPFMDVQSYVQSGRNDFSMFVVDATDRPGDQFVVVATAPATEEQAAIAAGRALADAALAELTG